MNRTQAFVEASRRGVFVGNDGREHMIRDLMPHIVQRICRLAKAKIASSTESTRLAGEECFQIWKTELLRRGIDEHTDAKHRVLHGQTQCVIRGCENLARYVVGKSGYCGKHQARAFNLRRYFSARIDKRQTSAAEHFKSQIVESQTRKSGRRVRKARLVSSVNRLD